MYNIGRNVRSATFVQTTKNSNGACNTLQEEHVLLTAVADPEFPRGWGRQSSRGRQHMILPNFTKNCMKLNEFGPRGEGAHPKFHYVHPALDWSANSFKKFVSRKITSRKHLMKNNASSVLVCRKRSPVLQQGCARFAEILSFQVNSQTLGVQVPQNV